MDTDTMNLIMVIATGLTALGTVVMAIATIVLVYAAFKGFSQWREQMNGTKRIELFSRMGVLAMDFEAHFRAARNPEGPKPIEYQERIKEKNESPELERARNMMYGHLQRLKPLGDIVREMHVLNWQAQILFDEDFTSYIETYWKNVVELRAAIIGYF